MTAQWPGHAAEEVERLITVPIETELNGLPNLVVMRSVSLYGLVEHSRHVHRWHRPLLRAPAGVRAARRRASCPTASSPDVEAPFSPSGLVYRYVLQSPDRSRDGAARAAGLGARQGVSAPCPASPTSRRSAARRCSTRCSSIRRKLAGAGLADQRRVGGARARTTATRGGGFYLRGRTVLLRPRARSRRDARGHRQHRARREERRAGAREGRRDASRSGTRRASASSASTNRTTRSKA